MEQPGIAKKVFNYFLQGLLVIAPIAVTAYAIYWVVAGLDDLIPIFTQTDQEGRVKVQNYGLGFILILGTITLIGYVSTFFIQSRIFHFFDYWLDKAPGIKFIYSTVKDFFEAFAGEKKKFNKPVLANIDDNDVWRIAFLTQEDVADFGLNDYVAVYVPMSDSIAGSVYIIPAKRIRFLDGEISPSEAMKFAISGGLTKVAEDENKN